VTENKPLAGSRRLSTLRREVTAASMTIALVILAIVTAMLLMLRDPHQLRSCPLDRQQGHGREDIPDVIGSGSIDTVNSGPGNETRVG
jgi:hypothetical protein